MDLQSTFWGAVLGVDLENKYRLRLTMDGRVLELEVAMASALRLNQQLHAEVERFVSSSHRLGAEVWTEAAQVQAAMRAPSLPLSAEGCMAAACT